MADWEWLVDILSNRSSLADPQGDLGPLPDPEDESEHDYEYDESQTETFYLNIDLNSSGWRGHAKTNPPLEASAPGRDDSPINERIQRSCETALGGLDTLDPTIQWNAAVTDAIQILELHSKCPIVKYQNQVFECRWADMIGTEVFLAPLATDVSDPILKQGDGFKIIATNNVKLIAQKLTLTPRYASTPPAPTHAAAGITSTTNDEAEDVPLPLNASDYRQKQVKFLHRFSRLKGARGETDQVPVHNAKSLNAMGPRGREVAAAALEEREAADQRSTTSLTSSADSDVNESQPSAEPEFEESTVERHHHTLETLTDTVVKSGAAGPPDDDAVSATVGSKRKRA